MWVVVGGGDVRAVGGGVWRSDAWSYFMYLSNYRIDRGCRDLWVEVLPLVELTLPSGFIPSQSAQRHLQVRLQKIASGSSYKNWAEIANTFRLFFVIVVVLLLVFVFIVCGQF